MADVIYQYGADVKQVLAALNQIDKTNEKVYKKAERDANRAIKSIISDHQRLLRITNQLEKSIDTEAKAFARAAKEAEKLANAGSKAGGGSGITGTGVQIGVVSGLVTELTRRFIDLSQAAVSAFVNMTQEAVQLASGLETTQTIFTGILGGNEDAAIAALQHIREESRGLGIDLAETSRAFLPFVSSLEELDRVNKISAALAISQPEQGELGARIALQEALSGNVQSLVRRFEIPKSLGKELQRALDEGGVEAFLTTFEGIMKRLGRDVDNLTDTFQFAFGKVAVTGEQLKTAFGVPITDQLKDQLNELNTVLQANFANFEGLATLAGGVIAEITSGFDAGGIAQFFADNKQDIAEFLTAIQEVVKSAKDLADIDLSKGFDVSKLTEATLKINAIVDGLNAIKSITESSEGGGAAFLGALEGGLSGVFPLFNAFNAIWENLNNVILVVIATYGGFIAIATKGQAILNNAYQEFLVTTGQIEESQKNLIDPQMAYQAAIDETWKAMREYKASTEEAAAAVDKTVIPTKKSTEANEGLTDSILALNKAQSDLADLEDEIAATQGEIGKEKEKELEAQKDFQRKLEDIDIETERKRLDIAIEFAQKREDAARDNLEKLADIRKKNQQDLQDAAIDLERKEEDISRKFSDERIDLEKSQREKRLEIETSFRQKLQDIRKKADFDLEEAERSRDAVAFLKIIRQRSQEVTEAQTDRQREIDELKVTGELKKQELAVQQQRELEQARLQNERKIQDLQLNLERQIEAQNIAYGRQVDDLTRAEQRKNEELARKRQEDIEDAQRSYDRKLEDLRAALEDELKLLEEFAAKKAALESQISSLEASIPAPTPSRTGGRQAGFGATPDTIGAPRARFEPRRRTSTGTPFAGFATGGMMRVRGTGGRDSQPVAFKASPGEGVRVYSPQEMSRMRYNEPGRVGNTSNVNNSKSINLSIPADRLTPGQRSEARMIAMEVLDEVS